MAVPLADQPGDLHAVHLRHFPVQQHQAVGVHFGVGNLHHVERILAAQAGVGPQVCFLQHHAGMLQGNGVVVHHQGPDLFGVKAAPGRGHLFALFEGHQDGERGSYALFGSYRDRAVHQLHHVLGDSHAQTSAAVFVVAGGILLGEGVEHPGEKLLADANACIADDEFERGLVVKDGGLLHGQGHAARRFGKLDGVAQDVDQHLLELHDVADVGAVHQVQDLTFKRQSLIGALGHDQGVDLLQHPAEGEGFVAQHHPAGLDAAHVQNVVDELQQVAGAVADFFQIIPGLRRQCLILQRQAVQADDGVHRGADFVAHVGEEGGLGAVGGFRLNQCFRQGFVPGHAFAHLRVDDRKAHADRVDDVIRPVFRVADAGHPDHFIVFPAVPHGQIPVHDDGVVRQGGADAVRLDELQEAFPVALGHVGMGVVGKGLQIGEMHPFGIAFVIAWIGPIAYGVVPVQVHVVDAAIVRSQGGDHLVLLAADFLLRLQLLLQGQAVLPLLFMGLGGRFRGFGLGHQCHVHAQAQGAQTAAFVCKPHLGGLEMTGVARGVRDVLDENIGLVHGQGLLVVLHKVGRGDGIKDVRVRQADHAGRARLVGVFGKGLIAGEIFAGGGVLGKDHGRHVGKQGGGFHFPAAAGSIQKFAHIRFLAVVQNSFSGGNQAFQRFVQAVRIYRLA